MTPIQHSLNCGAAVCELNAGGRVVDAGMEFVRCPTCRVLHIPPENLIHSNVPPDRVEKLSFVMKILLLMRMRWLRGELPQLGDKNAWVADVGCGDGQFLEFLGRRGYSKMSASNLTPKEHSMPANGALLSLRRVPTRRLPDW